MSEAKKTESTGQTIGSVLKAFNPIMGGGKAAGIINSPTSTVPFNEERIRQAEKEMNPEITTTINSVKELVRNVMKTIKSTVKLPLTAVTEVASHAIAIPANIFRTAGNVVRAVLRAPAGAADLLFEKTFGTVSRKVGEIRKGTHARIGKTLDWMDDIKGLSPSHT